MADLAPLALGQQPIMERVAGKARNVQCDVTLLAAMVCHVLDNATPDSGPGVAAAELSSRQAAGERGCSSARNIASVHHADVLVSRSAFI